MKNKDEIIMRKDEHISPGLERMAQQNDHGLKKDELIAKKDEQITQLQAELASGRQEFWQSNTVTQAVQKAA